MAGENQSCVLLKGSVVHEPAGGPVHWVCECGADVPCNDDPIPKHYKGEQRP